MSFLQKLFGSAKGRDSGQTGERDADVRPDWMKDGLAVSMMDGDDGLEVVGESFYMHNLQRLVGDERGRVRLEIAALLVADSNNPYDSNAVSIWIDGLKVGHLSRADAARLRPGLLQLEQAEGRRIALSGAIVGEDIYGVFLNYDPEDFGLPATRRPKPRTEESGSVRTGLSEAFLTDEDDDSYDLSWLDDLPEDNMRAIVKLRDLLEHDPDPIDRHYMFAELEARLYKSRDAFSSALDEYDEVCRRHDDEMDGIRAALFKKLNQIPLLDTYRQQAIRQSKAHNYEAGVRWVERGLELYGGDAARQEWVGDLDKRHTRLLQKLDRSSAPQPPARSTCFEAEESMENLVCKACGRSFERERTRGRKPHECPECRGR